MATRIFKEGSIERLSSQRMRDDNLQMMMIECDFEWVVCGEHGAELIQNILQQIIYINVVKECNMLINEVSRKQENDSANKRKIMQQASRLKWYAYDYIE